MTEVEFQAGDELDGDLQNEGDAGAADENADATAVSIEHYLIDQARSRVNPLSIRLNLPFVAQ